MGKPYSLPFLSPSVCIKKTLVPIAEVPTVDMVIFRVRIQTGFGHHRRQSHHLATQLA